MSDILTSLSLTFICNITFAVELCAGNQNTPPTVNPFSGATCDVSDVSNCNSVTFTGAGFTSGDTYTCGIQRYEV